MKVVYRQRVFLDRFRCIDRERKAFLVRHWWSENGNLLYGYVDRFNTICIAKEDIISIA